MSDYYRGLRDGKRFDKLEYRPLGWCALIGNVECFLFEPVTRLYVAGIAAAGCPVQLPKSPAMRSYSGKRQQGRCGRNESDSLLLHTIGSI